MQKTDSRILKHLSSEKKVLVYVCTDCNQTFSERELPKQACQCGSITFRRRLVTIGVSS